MDDGDDEDIVGVDAEERQSRLAANRPPSSSAIVAAAAAAANEDDGNTFDCDSEELEALEDAAEEEDVDEEELNREVDRAAELYPSGVVEDLLEELKQEGMMQFMQRHVFGKTEGQVKALFIAFGVLLPRELRTQSMTPELLVSILKTILTRHLRQRKKLEQYNTMDDAVELVKRSRNIIVLSGSGISTSVGIPDFRSKDGIYAQLQREGKYNLIDPQEMFDIDYFLHDPSCFFSFAKRIFPSNFLPSPCHRFIKLLETKGKLTRNYTQNIDTLEQVAGIENVLYCHGSFSQAKCTTPGCGYEVAGSAIKEDIFAQRIPYCPKCEDAFQEKKKQQQEAMKMRQSMKKGNKKAKSGRSYGGDSDDDDSDDDDDGQADTLRGLGVVKPCITFFGEKLSDEFDRNLLADRSKVDLLIVIGTSLQVAPVSELVGHIPHRTPVILINKTPVLHMGMDIQLLGDADTIIQYLCNRLEWDLPLLPEPNKEVVGTESKAEEVANEILDKGPEGEEVAVALLNEGKMEKEELREEEEEAAKSGGVQEPKRLGDTHFWLFPGAEAETLMKMLEEKERQGEESGDDSENKESNASSASPPLQQEGQEIEESSRGVKRSASGDLETSSSNEAKIARHL